MCSTMCLLGSDTKSRSSLHSVSRTPSSPLVHLPQVLLQCVRSFSQLLLTSGVRRLHRSSARQVSAANTGRDTALPVCSNRAAALRLCTVQAGLHTGPQPPRNATLRRGTPPAAGLPPRYPGRGGRDSGQRCPSRLYTLPRRVPAAQVDKPATRC